MSLYAKRTQTLQANYHAKKASSVGYFNKPHSADPFGPGVAQEIFGLYENNSYLYDEPECDFDDGDTVEEEQLSLPLESVREMEARFQNEINKWKRDYRKMMVCALKYYYILRDCDEHQDLDRAFKDFQMLRKLKGCDGV
jgi:hypothetical protein